MGRNEGEYEALSAEDASKLLKAEMRSPAPSNALGIASLIVGALSLAICWIPLLNFFSFVLGIFGIILAIIGCIICLNRGFKGIAYPISGGVVSVLSIAGAIALYVAVAGAAAKNLERAKAQSAPTAPSTASSSGTTQPEQPLVAPAGPSTWVKLTGPVNVRVVKAVLGRVAIKNMGEAKESKDILLLLTIEATNTSDGKKVDYVSFSSPATSMHATAKLEDDLENSYTQSTFGYTSVIVGTCMETSLYPGKTASDVVVFEPPVGKAKWLDLTLKTIGGESAQPIRIPIDFIAKAP